MQTSTLEFPHNARRTYTALRHLFEMKRTQFSGVRNKRYLLTGMKKVCSYKDICL